MAATPPPTEPPGDEPLVNKDGQTDLSALARQYVDLWQQQLSGAASDEALAGVMAQTVQLMNTGAASMASYATSQAANKANKDGGNTDVGETRAAPVAASSGTDDTVVDELHRRIEQLEKRIAALESAAGGKSP